MSRAYGLPSDVGGPNEAQGVHGLFSPPPSRKISQPSSFAYRNEFSRQLVSLFYERAIAVWLRRNPRLSLVNWEESNAFCNVQREGLPQATPVEHGIAPQPWYGDFFAHLNVFLRPPFWLVGAYKLPH